MPKHCSITPVPVTMVFLLLLSSAAAAQPSEDSCILEVKAENRHRRVYASARISAECDPGHTRPFGNWAVESPYTTTVDGDQFQGWYLEGDDPKPQWNSCTTNPRWAPSLSNTYHNFDERDGTHWGQKAEPDDTRVWGAWTVDAGEGPCMQALSGGHTVSAIMEIFELDRIPFVSRVPVLNRLPGVVSDAHVATLRYGDEAGEVEIEFMCADPTDPWLCSGESKWLWPVIVSPASSKVDAQVRISVSTRRGGQ